MSDKPDYKQTLTITITTAAGEISTSFTANEGIVTDEIFYEWFVNLFNPLGFPSITEELKK